MEVDQKFVDFMLKESKEPAVRQWIEEIVRQYSEKLSCPLCGSEKLIDIIVAPQAFMSCGACHARTDFSVDKLRPRDYNTVTFLYKDKIKEILGV